LIYSLDLSAGLFGNSTGALLNSFSVERGTVQFQQLDCHPRAQIRAAL
jgi:hypothetical protein